MEGKQIMIMPFGEHQDEEIKDLPSGYLGWLARDCNNEEIAMAADEEYQHREKYNCHIWKE